MSIERKLTASTEEGLGIGVFPDIGTGDFRGSRRFSRRSSRGLRRRLRSSTPLKRQSILGDDY